MTELRNRSKTFEFAELTDSLIKDRLVWNSRKYLKGKIFKTTRSKFGKSTNRVQSSRNSKKHKQKS